ncbi:MAG TPA: lamin tail domain-containing protein, partial [Blastocatellia bacterium]|nr:lamin tail domain-containing protein [Blastocatellia bacterium]
MLKRVCAWLVIPSLWLVAPVKTELRTAGLKPGAQAVPLIVNEYLADPPGSVATDLIGDANGDGVRSATQDEFVELVNTGTSPVNIGGFTISDATAVRFTFPVGTTIPAGEATVVFGGGTPAGPFGNAAANVLVFAAGGSGLSLNNSADSIIIKSATAIEVARRDYPASDGTAHEAITRSPDITGEFGKHSLAAGSGGRKFSPGTLVNGRPFVSNDPAIASISPEVVVAGAGVVSLTVTGNKFVSGSHVRIDATPLMTMFVSPDELRADVPASVTAAAGSHAITVENPDSSVSNAAAFTVLSAVGINEFLADPPDGDAGDANGDGERSSSEDEFVEIVNRTSAPIDISGFSISDVTQQRFTFPPGSILPAGEAAVVFGGGSPRGEFGNAMPNGLVFTAALSLNNGGDTITLKDAGSAAIETVVYGSAQGNASESVNRSPETVSVALALHSSITESGGRLFSPGTRVDGSPFTVGPRITRIIPDSAVRSTGPLNITVQGTGFEGDSTVLVDSSPVMTRFISASELTAEAPASVAASVGDHRVMVRNVGGNRSNQATLTIIRPAPVLRSVLPRMVESGTSPILFLEGADFDGAVVLVEGAPVPTTLASSTVLSATLSSGLTAALGARRVRVRNVDGQLSNELTVEVIAPGPRILSLRPDSARAGSPGFQMTLSGANYQPGAVVIFDRVPLMTEFVSAAELRADVPASLVEEAGLR